MMPNTSVMALPSSVTSLDQYTQLVESFPRLDEQEERTLAERVRRDNDVTAAIKLITSHLRYVVYIARGYAGYGLPQEDLVQEGTIGLMKAVRRFDPGRGIRLVVYAGYWIRAQIHDFILKNWRMVKVTTTKARRKLFYRLRSAKKRLDWLKRNEAEEIARKLGVDADDVIDMETQMYVPDQSVDAPDTDSDDRLPGPAGRLADTSAAPEQIVIEDEFLDSASSALRKALSALDPRSRDIIESRWLADDGDRLTLQALGDRHGVSAERIRQLEVAAIGRLREMMTPSLGVDRCSVGLPTQRNILAV